MLASVNATQGAGGRWLRSSAALLLASVSRLAVARLTRVPRQPSPPREGRASPRRPRPPDARRPHGALRPRPRSPAHRAPALPDLTRLRERRPVGAAEHPGAEPARPAARVRGVVRQLRRRRARARREQPAGGRPRHAVLGRAEGGLGRWYSRHLTRPDDPDWVEWDAFFVYPPGDTWEQAGARPARWGRTIIGKREELRAAVAPLLK